MKRLLLLLALHLVFATPLAVAAEKKSTPNPDPASLLLTKEETEAARKLIPRLADPAYVVREEATRELAGMGRAALPALQEAIMTEVNAELRLRCELLLPHATADDLRAKLDCFLADKEGKYNHNLPGHKAFFEILGKSEAARDLFRDIALSPENRQLLFAVEGKKDDLARLVQERRALFQGRQVIVGGQVSTDRAHPTLTDIVAILFAEIHVPDRSNGPRVTTINSPAYWLNQPTFRDAMTANKTKDALNGLLNKWIDTRTDAYSLYALMNNATSQKLPFGMACAKRLLDSNIAGPGIYKAHAVTYIARNGSAEEHLKLLEPAFKDETVVSTVFINANKRHVVQMRDLALAMALVLTKQDPLDYGFASRYSKGGAVETMKYNFNNFHFDDSDGKAKEAREAAFKKWDDWLKANPKSTK